MTTRNSPGRARSLNEREALNNSVEVELGRGVRDQDFSVASMVLDHAALHDKSIYAHTFEFIMCMVTCALPVSMSVLPFAILQNSNAGADLARKVVLPASYVNCFRLFTSHLLSLAAQLVDDWGHTASLSSDVRQRLCDRRVGSGPRARQP